MSSSRSTSARWLTGFALLLIAASAIALQRGATAAWGIGHTPTGEHLRLSPIGLVRLGASGQVVECRWWPPLGDAELCAVAPGGDAAMVRLRRAYPLAVVAMWIAVLALFLNVLAMPRNSPWVGSLVAALGSALAAASVWSATAATQAINALADASVRFAHAGFLGVSGAAVLLAVAAGLLAFSRSPGRVPGH